MKLAEIFVGHSLKASTGLSDEVSEQVIPLIRD